MRRYGINVHRVHNLIWLVVTLFVFLGSLFFNVYGETYMSLFKEPFSTVTSPPVILQRGAAGTSTIYTNNTSARVSVGALNWLGGWNKLVKITINARSRATTYAQHIITIEIA